MNGTQHLAAAAAAIALVACAPMGAGPEPATNPEGPCDAAPVQGLIGRAVDSAVGAEAMRLAGARALRWIGPNQAVTMDFRPDRLNVEYDESRRVTAIRCG